LGYAGRREFLAAACGLLAATIARAQAPNAIRQIGLLWIHSPALEPWLDALRAGLRAHGYEEGKNIRIDQGSLVNGYDELPTAAERLARAKVDVIVAYGSTAVLAAHKAAPAIPVVMTIAGDPVKLGVAASLARPGKNVTGLTSQSATAAGKRLELLREIMPSLRKCAVLLYPRSESELESLREMEEGARTLKIEVHAVAIHNAAAIESAVASIGILNVQAITVIGSTLFSANRERLISAVAKLNLPASYANVAFVEAGGLAAYAPDIGANFREAAVYVDKIFKGAMPGDLPIAQPIRWTLAINMRTAKALGLTIPPSVLLRADRVVE